jgi:CheY-like chemotaxis protein
MESLGHQESSPAAGGRRWPSWSSGFDLIFMDIEFPEMEALATWAIRDGKKGGHVPIIRMTEHH